MSGPAAGQVGATPLAGKTALVTGAATGIGRAIAAVLAAAGASVVINHNHTPELADKVVAEITAATAAAADISIRAEYRAMVDQMLAEFGRWDILVNNAAVAITKPFHEITEAEFDLSFAVNVKGVFHGLQLAWEHLADGGRIITISSSTTALMLPGYAVYDATKGAVEQFTHILSKEFGPRMALSYYAPLVGVPGVEFRLQRETLYNSIFVYDEQMLVNQHVYGMYGYMAPILHLRRIQGGDFFDMYIKSFERVWDVSFPVEESNFWRQRTAAINNATHAAPASSPAR